MLFMYHQGLFLGYYAHDQLILRLYQTGTNVNSKILRSCGMYQEILFFRVELFDELACFTQIM